MRNSEESRFIETMTGDGRQLNHYGVRGMKWRQHKAQDQPEGNSTSGSGNRFGIHAGRMRAEAEAAKAHAIARAKAEQSKAKKVFQIRKDFLSKKLSSFSKDEISEATNYINHLIGADTNPDIEAAKKTMSSYEWRKKYILR